MTEPTNPIPQEIKTTIISALGEMSEGTVAWQKMSRSFSKEELIGEIENSSALGKQFCSELLRVARDLIARKATVRHGVPEKTVSVLEEGGKDWLKSLKVLYWEHEGGNEAEEFVPLISEEENAWLDGLEVVPTLHEVTGLGELNGDRVLEVRDAVGEIVYDGREAVDEELSRFAEYAPK